MDLILMWLITLVLGFWIFKLIKKWEGLPPGPWGLPVVGYLPFLDRNQPQVTLTNLSKQYGPIYGISMGSIYTVVLTDHRMIRDAFAKDSFSGRAPLYLTHGIMQGNGIICAEGGLWKDQRKLVSSWLKNFGMSKHSVSREKLEKRIASGAYELLNMVEKCGKSPVNLRGLLSNSLGNIINEIIFGLKFPADDKTWQWLQDIQEEGVHEMGIAGVVNFLPFVRHFSASTTETMRVLTRGQAQTHRFHASIINRRRKILGLATPEGAAYPLHEDIFQEHPEGHIKCVKYSKHSSSLEEHYFDPETMIPTDGECVIDNFLMEQKKRFENDEELSKYMTDKQLLFLISDLFGAGLDTTATTLSWFFLFMAMKPEEQEIVRKEILSVYPEDGIVDHSNLPHLMAAICETQRIRSITPVGIPHGCIETTYLGDYKIPKGTMVMPLLWAVHMDPDVWESPEEFRPSRFLTSDGSLIKPSEFIPFQTGKRMCPGDELSRMITCGVVARLLRTRRVRLACPVPSPEDMRGYVGVTLEPPSVTFFCEPL